jgi:hypothetical protein
MERADQRLQRAKGAFGRDSTGLTHAQSLEEDLSETSLLRRLEMTEFSTSFATTNCIASVNSHLERTTRNVKRWRNSLLCSR